MSLAIYSELPGARFLDWITDLCTLLLCVSMPFLLFPSWNLASIAPSWSIGVILTTLNSFCELAGAPFDVRNMDLYQEVARCLEEMDEVHDFAERIRQKKVGP